MPNPRRFIGKVAFHQRGIDLGRRWPVPINLQGCGLSASVCLLS